MGCLLSIKAHENCPENGAHGSGKEYRQDSLCTFLFKILFVYLFS